MKIKFLSCIVLISSFVIVTGCAKNTEKMPPRVISVTGEGEVKAVPDKIILSLNIESQNMVLDVAKSQNDGIVKSVLAVIADYKIAPKDVQTNSLRIESQYKNIDWGIRGKFLGYAVSQTTNVTLRDISKYDSFLSDILKTGISGLNYVRFGIEDSEKYKRESRDLAVKNAKNKAEQLAGKMGAKLGKAVYVSDRCGDKRRSSAVGTGVIFASDYSFDTTENVDILTIATGNQIIWSCVTIDFELK